MLSKTIKSQFSGEYDVEFRDEEWQVSATDPPTSVHNVYTLRGDWIGDVDLFQRLHKKGITHFELAKPDHTICSIGYNPTEKKWYGWSHRAIQGFGINSYYAKLQAKTVCEAKQLARKFAEDVS